MPPFSPGKRVVVLGAGATRGSAVSRERLVKPPLNADFFTQVQRIASEKHVAKVRAVINDVVQMFGANFSLTMEDYFTHLESFEVMNNLVPRSSRGISQDDIRTMRDNLMALLAAVLEESTDVSKREVEHCEYHANIIEQLEVRDTLISFNYDCVVDHALRRTASGRWSAKYGYAFSDPVRVHQHEYWDSEDAPTKAGKSLHLLKLHGSINWQLSPHQPVETDEIRLKQRLYQQRGVPRFSIIPPAFAKDVTTDPTFRVLWANAERAIRQAEVIALVGFSFPPTDRHVDSLFRLARTGSKGSLRSLVIANPSEADRRRTRSVFAPSLEKGCLVREYSSIEELASHAQEALALEARSRR
ncbi:MAG: hypothetical protein F4052_03790 [Dehalococcoidia bacterium]|nr:hypothetical protein [Dehalococcoidia bacterium]MYK26062.1 hypothetical protein [Dehalococcoidia bacterium]